MAVAVGGLFVDLGASVVSFERDMKKAEALVNSSSARMNRALGTIDKGWARAEKGIAGFAKQALSMRNIVATVAGGTGLGLIVKHALSAGDALQDMADQAGVSTKFLQEMRYAAGQAGSSADVFDTALVKLSQNLGDAQNGTGGLLKSLQALDPALARQVQGAKSTEEAYLLIMEAARKFGSATERNAFLVDAFGKAGVKMTGLVIAGAAGVDKLRAAAQALGVVLDEGAIKKLAEANDKFDALKSIIDAKMAKAVADNADSLLKLADALIVVAGVALDPKVLTALTAAAGGALLGLAAGGPPGAVVGGGLAYLMSLQAQAQDTERNIAAVSAELAKARALADADILPGAFEAVGIETWRQKVQALEAELAKLELRLESIKNAQAMTSAAPTENFGTLSGADIKGQALGIMRDDPERRLEMMARQIEAAADARTKFAELRAAGIEANMAIKESALDMWDAYSEAAAEAARKGLEANAEIKASALEMWDNYKKTLDEDAQAVRDASRQMAGGISTFFQDLISGSAKAEDAIKTLQATIINALVSIVQQRLITAPLNMLMDTALGALGGLFGGAAGAAGRAHGGPVMAGTPYTVGEQGRETFIPAVNGTILPHGVSAGGNVVNINLNSADAVDAFRRSPRQVRRAARAQLGIGSGG